MYTLYFVCMYVYIYIYIYLLYVYTYSYMYIYIHIIHIAIQYATMHVYVAHGTEHSEITSSSASLPAPLCPAQSVRSALVAADKGEVAGLRQLHRLDDLNA